MTEGKEELDSRLRGNDKGKAMTAGKKDRVVFQIPLYLPLQKGEVT